MGTIEVVNITDNLTVCIDKLKRVRQRLLSGKCLQPTAFLPIRHFIVSPEQCQQLGLFILESILADEEFCHLSTDERYVIQVLFSACKDCSSSQDAQLKMAIEKANEAVAALQPGKKHIWIHATRRKVNHHLPLAAEYCGYVFTRDWPGTWVYEASIAYVFGYQKYRYVTEQDTVNRLNRIIDYLTYSNIRLDN